MKILMASQFLFLTALFASSPSFAVDTSHTEAEGVCTSCLDLTKLGSSTRLDANTNPSTSTRKSSPNDATAPPAEK